MTTLNIKDATNKKVKVLGYDKSSGSRLRKGDVSAIGDELSNLTTDGGCVNPEDVVEAASDPSSVMHKYFTWNDKEAGKKLRLVEAGYIIRSMRMKITYVRIERESQEPQLVEANVKMLHSTKSPETGNYVYKQVANILQDVDATESVIADMYRYLLGAYHRFNDFGELCDDLDKLEDVILGIGQKLGLSKSKVKSQIARIRKGV